MFRRATVFCILVFSVWGGLAAGKSTAPSPQPKCPDGNPPTCFWISRVSCPKGTPAEEWNLKNDKCLLIPEEICTCFLP